MKNILLILLTVLLVGCTTTKYVFIDPKDSTKLVEVRKRVIYDDLYYSAPIMSTPLWWDWNYYRFRQPIIVNPRPIIVNPRPRVQPQPRWTPPPSRNDNRAPIRKFNNR